MINTLTKRKQNKLRHALPLIYSFLLFFKECKEDEKGIEVSPPAFFSDNRAAAGGPDRFK